MTSLRYGDDNMINGPQFNFEIASAIQQERVKEALKRRERSGIDAAPRATKTRRFTSFPNIVAARTRTALARPLSAAGLSTMARRRA